MALNEVFGWASILLGALSGAALGLRFQREGFLGGYGSLPRRMVRLGHISFFGLGILNVLFAHTAPRLALDPAWTGLASAGFVLGGATMPACCGLMAWRPSLQPLFAVPVAGVLVGAGLTCLGLLLR